MARKPCPACRRLFVFSDDESEVMCPNCGETLTVNEDRELIASSGETSAGAYTHMLRDAAIPQPKAEPSAYSKVLKNPDALVAPRDDRSAYAGAIQNPGASSDTPEADATVDAYSGALRNIDSMLEPRSTRSAYADALADTTSHLHGPQRSAYADRIEDPLLKGPEEELPEQSAYADRVFDPYGTGERVDLGPPKPEEPPPPETEYTGAIDSKLLVEDAEPAKPIVHLDAKGRRYVTPPPAPKPEPPPAPTHDPQIEDKPALWDATPNANARARHVDLSDATRTRSGDGADAHGDVDVGSDVDLAVPGSDVEIATAPSGDTTSSAPPDGDDVDLPAVSALNLDLSTSIRMAATANLPTPLPPSNRDDVNAAPVSALQLEPVKALPRDPVRDDQDDGSDVQITLESALVDNSHLDVTIGMDDVNVDSGDVDLSSDVNLGADEILQDEAFRESDTDGTDDALQDEAFRTEPAADDGSASTGRLVVNCPACGAPHDVSGLEPGTQIDCLVCSAVITVPDEAVLRMRDMLGLDDEPLPGQPRRSLADLMQPPADDLD